MRTPKRFDNNDLPFKKFRSELDGMFQRFFEDPFFTNSNNQEPASNIIEKENHYLIEVEVPGVNPNDVEIDVEGNMLKIKGERKQSFEQGDTHQRCIRSNTVMAVSTGHLLFQTE